MDPVAIDVHDDVQLRDWHAVATASAAHDRPQAVNRTYAALAASVRDPGPYQRLVLLAAREGDRTIGTAELRFSVQDNTHLADLELQVHPDARRRGGGRALFEAADELRRTRGCTTVCGEVVVPGANATSPGLEFSRVLGFESAHVEDHLLLHLPVGPDEVTVLADRAGSLSDSYDIVTWGNRCPDELAAAYCKMKTRMSNDVPVGDVDYEPIVYTEERMRTQEERTSRSYTQIVAAARRLDDGTVGGYSQVFLAHGTDQAIQDDTLVMPDHRGRRLGTALKLATLEVVQRDHPERRTFHTWTAPDNHAMYRTNLHFGYVPVERMHEMQRKDG